MQKKDAMQVAELFESAFPKPSTLLCFKGAAECALCTSQRGLGFRVFVFQGCCTVLSDGGDLRGGEVWEEALNQKNPNPNP